MRLHFRRKLYAFYCKNNKWNNFSSCWWSNIVHGNILCFAFPFFRCISFDFICYLEPKLFRELTRKPTTSFIFLACTLFSLYLIYLVLQSNFLECNINHVHRQKHNKDYYYLLLSLLSERRFSSAKLRKSTDVCMLGEQVCAPPPSLPIIKTSAKFRDIEELNLR